MPGLASRRPQSFRPNAKRKLRPGGYAAMDHPVGRTVSEVNADVRVGGPPGRLT
jgi:hypothetical protein